MKLFIAFTSIILCFVLHSFTYPTTHAEESINLEDAIKKGLVKINVKGLGGHSGNCLEAKIRNISSKNISLIIKPGTLFKPNDTSMQDIVVVRGLLFALEKNNVKTQKLMGFCCKSSNRCPSVGMDFKLVKVSNAKLIEMATYLSKAKCNENAMQSAIWSISNGHSVSEIYDDDAQKVKALRAEVCRLTGQKDNWYSTNTNRVINERGYIQSEPVLVNGLIKVNLEKPAAIFQGIYKENGDVVEAPEKLFDVPGRGELTFKFSLKVKGWEKGKYYVKVNLSDKEILRQEFTI